MQIKELCKSQGHERRVCTEFLSSELTLPVLVRQGKAQLLLRFPWGSDGH